MADVLVDAAVDAEGQPIAGHIDLVEHLVEPMGLPAHDVQDRAEDLVIEPPGAVDLEGARGEEGAVLGPGRQRTLIEEPALASHAKGVLLQRLAGRLVDDRADIGFEQRRVADRELGHRTRQHRQQAVGDVVLHIEEAQRRAALPGAVEGGAQNVDDDLLGQGRGIDDHRVLSAGLGDQRHDRAGAAGEREVDLAARFRSSR